LTFARRRTSRCFAARATTTPTQSGSRCEKLQTVADVEVLSERRRSWRRAIRPMLQRRGGSAPTWMRSPLLGLRAEPWFVARCFASACRVGRAAVSSGAAATR
jgi:hypothetical protein